MADTEFEQFHCNNYFEKLSAQHYSITHPYTLVHDVYLEDDSPETPQVPDCKLPEAPPPRALAPSSSDEDVHRSSVFGSGAGLQSRDKRNDKTDKRDSRDPQPERKRRKLPAIPHQKKNVDAVMSLADELGETLYSQPQFTAGDGSIMIGEGMHHPRSFLMLKCLGDGDQDFSPTTDQYQSIDGDSGNSTAHSPESSRLSNIFHDATTPGSTCASSIGLPFTQLELLEATHRALHKFLPRHHDELEIEIGDPIYVQKEAEDLWCEGVNMRTGRQGIFPSAYAVDLEYEDFDSATPKVKRERFLIGYLGSVETICHKGNVVLCQAVKKITTGQHKPQSCILEVSDQGLRMNDKTKPSKKKSRCQDYFYSLKNVTFCAFHPEDNRYMGFITKHPQLQRFACHVFLAAESTRPVVESVGRALQRFYEKFLETAYPIEEMYIEDEF